MPEAAINEEGDLLFWQDEVWPPGYLAWVHGPASDTVSHQRRSESPLRRSISSRPDKRHSMASLLNGKDIHLVYL